VFSRAITCFCFCLFFVGGVLWHDYMTKITPHSTTSPKISQLLATIHNALIPSERWRHLATQCIDHHLNSESGGDRSGYIVLHTRIESDMMVHRCGRDMEFNLTTVLGMLDTFVHEYNNNYTHNHDGSVIKGTMIAVNRNWFKDANDKNNIDLQMYNLNVLNQQSVSYSDGNYSFLGDSAVTKTFTTANNNSNSTSYGVLFECGDGWVDEAFYNNPQATHRLPYDYYADIVPALLNFWIAVQADIFVGVMRSSWSTDVWTARYYQGKGQYNYQYTKGQGIIPVPDNGLPPGHQC
jgi:hypothetical protein